MEALHQWFFSNRRDFPWRVQPTPYKVWISEVMLQQTRAAVVVPYFLRWMDLFPTVEILASSPVELIIKAWEGLGYYSRARNLHAAAQQIVSEFRGEIPATREELATLKGVGPYTIGALLSFGFHQKAAAVDGNVIRVVCRYFGIEENVCRLDVRKKIEQKTEGILDDKSPWVTMEALIELGATLCGIKPKCDGCPLRSNCMALKQGKMDYLPIKNQPNKIILLQRIVLILVSEGKALVKKGNKNEVMADLYEFPYFEKGSASLVRKSIPLKLVQHTFTRYKAYLYPHLIHLEGAREIKGYEWVEIKALSKLPFSAGHRKIMQELCTSYT